jgi:hypothetical protein
MAAATISKSSSAPSGDISLSSGQATFTLNDTTKTYSTEDPQLISAAQASAEFSVELPPVVDEAGTVVDSDPNDPRLHREADHLSAQASPETIAAAESNEAAIKAVATAADNQASNEGGPTVQQALEQQFVNSVTDVAPEVPYVTPDHTPVAAADTAPATDTSAPAAPATDTSSSSSPAADTSSSAPAADSTSTGAKN